MGLQGIISARMRAIAEAVPKSQVVCDVGCDHGYIGCALLESGRAEHVLFSDVSAQSLRKAERLAARRGLSGRASFVRADGLSYLNRPKEGEPAAVPKSFGGISDGMPVDCAVVAGMGGREMGEIALASPEAAALWVFQPMKNGAELRDALVGSGFCILSDRMIADGGRFYDLITAERGQDSLTDLERRYGRTNLEELGEAFLCALRRRERILKEVLAGEVAGPARREREAELGQVREILSRPHKRAGEGGI